MGVATVKLPQGGQLAAPEALGAGLDGRLDELEFIIFDVGKRELRRSHDGATKQHGGDRARSGGGLYDVCSSKPLMDSRSGMSRGPLRRVGEIIILTFVGAASGVAIAYGAVV
jgi:hypothetical protein